MTKPTRRRGCKLHPWVNKTVLEKFDEIVSRLGFTRDGAFELAMVAFIGKYKGVRNAADIIG